MPTSGQLPQRAQYVAVWSPQHHAKIPKDQQIGCQLSQRHAAFVQAIVLIDDQQQLQRQRRELANLLQRAHSVSPLAVLARGYAIVTDDHGEVLRDAAAVSVGQRIHARLGQSSLTATVTACHETRS